MYISLPFGEKFWLVSTKLICHCVEKLWSDNGAGWSQRISNVSAIQLQHKMGRVDLFKIQPKPPSFHYLNQVFQSSRPNHTWDTRSKPGFESHVFYSLNLELLWKTSAVQGCHTSWIGKSNCISQMYLAKLTRCIYKSWQTSLTEHRVVPPDSLSGWKNKKYFKIIGYLNSPLTLKLFKSNKCTVWSYELHFWSWCKWSN